MQRLARPPSRPATTPRWPSVCVAFGSGPFVLACGARAGHLDAARDDAERCIVQRAEVIQPLTELQLGDAGREQRAPCCSATYPSAAVGWSRSNCTFSCTCSSMQPRRSTSMFTWAPKSYTYRNRSPRWSRKALGQYGGCVCAAAAILPPVDVQAVQRRIAPGKYDVQAGVELGEGRRPTDQMAERLRHWLHLPPKWQWTTNPVCHALPTTAARRLSPFVAGGVVPCGTALSLQPLENKARSKNSAGWHRFCLLLELRPDAMGKSFEVSLDAWRHADLQ